MKNNFVNIDSIFNKLKHGEESYNSDAWSNMEDLLDQNITKGKPIRKSFYKYIIPIAILIFIGGGVAWYGNNKNENEINSSFHKETGLTSNHSSTIINDLEKKRETLKDQIADENKNPSPSFNEKNIALLTNEKYDNKNEKYDNKISKNTINQPKNRQPADKNNATAKNKNQTYSKAEQLLATSPLLFDEKDKPKTIEEERVVEVILQNKNASKEDIHKKKTEEAKWQSKVAVLDNQTIAKNVDNGFYYKEQRDTTKVIELLNKIASTNNHYYDTQSGLETLITDTISIVKVEKVKYTPLNISDQIRVSKLIENKHLVSNAELNISNNDLNLESAEYRSEKKEVVNLVPLNNFKTKTKSIQTFNKIRNTAGGLAQIFDGTNNFYASIILGGNANISNVNAFGMQVGIGLSYILAERWTLSAEFKFINKYFPKFKFTDESSEYEINKNRDNSGTWIYSGNGNIVSNNYTIHNFNTLSLPIYISYNISSRLALFGGANINYILPVKWNKENSIAQLSINTQSNSSDLYQNKNFLIDENNDFKGRFGLGYTAGVNYDVSRKISINARMTQSLWNNHKSNLKELDRILYAPSFELSMGIYFGRRDKVIYIMDRK